jgi:hypothetical protein
MNLEGAVINELDERDRHTPVFNQRTSQYL